MRDVASGSGLRDRVLYLAHECDAGSGKRQSAKASVTTTGSVVLLVDCCVFRSSQQ